MIPDTFMDSFPLVRNSLEKQGTRFHEAFLIEKRVVSAFRISHQRSSIKKGLSSATLLKKRLWRRCSPVNFTTFLRTSFLQNTSGQLLLCFMAFSDWEFLPQLFKNICCWKIDCGKYYRLSAYFIEFPRTLTGTAKAIPVFKETNSCKIPQTVGAIWSPATDFS